ncbi:MAG: mannonate dehydratase [Ignavibacteriales bacterium]|nr:mannonate dehydratase [Ignavibacteriales bacterium]
MAFEQTWRWFGPKDPITLKEIKQTGATGIVNALHQIPVGEIWTIDEIQKRKNIIEAEGFNWSVVESLPVHENIKKRKNNFKELTENYKHSIINLAQCGIDTICYNFMPVLDWSRTELRVTNKDGSITSKFNAKVFRTFDLFILERENSQKDYNPAQISEAKNYFDTLSNLEKKQLTETVLYGLPGSLEAYSLKDFKNALKEYNEIGDSDLRNNLYEFIKEIMPTAEEHKIGFGIHPDDPPWSLLGLPRVVSNKSDIENILNAYNSLSNGLTFCTGSFGASIKNNLVDMVKTFANKINFIHLRNVNRNDQNDFIEAYHLEGEIDLYSIIKELLIEQKKRIENNRNDFRMPMRPDHGHLMIPEFDKKGIYPGYSLFGRMRGLAELRGLELGIIKSLS